MVADRYVALCNCTLGVDFAIPVADDVGYTGLTDWRFAVMGNFYIGIEGLVVPIGEFRNASKQYCR